jgi:7-cyano-7-deazaguanine synthase
MKTVLILSGGLDSTTLLYELLAEKHEVYALSFDYGQRHVKEIGMAMHTCHHLQVPHRIVSLSSLTPLLSNSSLTNPDIPIPYGSYEEESMKLTVVPARNLIMSSIAIGYAANIGAGQVALGVHAGDHAIYPDCRPAFIYALNAVAHISHFTPINIYTPFMYETKGGIVKRGLKLGVDYSLTWTCYEGKDKPCGKCGACVERAEAFAANHVEDPLCIG